jgi:hypothetical protein
VKYEEFLINSFQDNQQKPCGLTDGQTNRPKLAKQYTPSSSKEDIIIKNFVEKTLLDIQEVNILRFCMNKTKKVTDLKYFQQSKHSIF